MLQMAQQALASPLIADGQPSPTSIIDGARTRLRQTGDNPAFAPDAAAAGYGADSVDKFNARRTLLTDNERVARESANAVSAAEAAKRQAEADKRRAELRAKLPAYLEVAKRFAAASQSGNERAALAELSQDVVMQTPTGSYRGINQVVAAVPQQSASGQQGSLGTPRIEGDRILANGNSGAYRITTTFGFDDSNHISRIDISL